MYNVGSAIVKLSLKASMHHRRLLVKTVIESRYEIREVSVHLASGSVLGERSETGKGTNVSIYLLVRGMDVQ